METPPDIAQDAVEVPSGCLPASPKKRNKKRIKPMLLTRDQLDGRTSAAKEFDRIVRSITVDLGGDITTIEQSLVEGFAGASVVLQNLIAQMALGRAIDVSDLAQSVSSLVRVASRLGEQRRMRPTNGPVPPHRMSSARADLIDGEAS